MLHALTEVVFILESRISIVSRVSSGGSKVMPGYVLLSLVGPKT